MNGANERPNPVVTTSTGTATYTVNGSNIDYVINVTGMTNVRAAHIHIGTSGKAGNILVTLFGGPTTGAITGELVRGTITDANSPISIPDLLHLMQEGNTYTNVHTDANTGGEIRGQIVPVP
jgi:hypothetical protein